MEQLTAVRRTSTRPPRLPRLQIVPREELEELPFAERISAALSYDWQSVRVIAESASSEASATLRLLRRMEERGMVVGCRSSGPGTSFMSFRLALLTSSHAQDSCGKLKETCCKFAAL